MVGLCDVVDRHRCPRIRRLACPAEHVGRSCSVHRGASVAEYLLVASFDRWDELRRLVPDCEAVFGSAW
ncbi:Uncharacterised protein [Chlamydia trachomatis]|nr:Uncharacterised protein [Chlamydia trachomatis]